MDGALVLSLILILLSTRVEHCRTILLIRLVKNLSRGVSLLKNTWPLLVKFTTLKERLLGLTFSDHDLILSLVKLLFCLMLLVEELIVSIFTFNRRSRGCFL